MKKLLPVVFAIALVFGLEKSGMAATINAKGTSGVCKAVNTSPAVTILDGSKTRTTATIYCTQAVNCEQGDTFGNAPATTPTTGAIGTGAGFPIVASQYVALGAARAIDLGQVGALVNLDPGNRLDCIAQASNGFCCTWEQF